MVRSFLQNYDELISEEIGNINKLLIFEDLRVDSCFQHFIVGDVHTEEDEGERDIMVLIKREK